MDQKIVRPEIGGSSAGDLIKELDLVGYMEAIGKKKTISFDPCEKYYAKNTCQLASLIDIPTLTDSRNDFLTGIISQYGESVEKRKAIVGEYNAVLDVIHDQVSKITDAATCNAFVTFLNGLTHVWDSKLQGGLIARDRAKELGLVLNKDKKYEPAKKTEPVKTEPPVTTEPTPEIPADIQAAIDGSGELDLGDSDLNTTKPDLTSTKKGQPIKIF